MKKNLIMLAMALLTIFGAWAEGESIKLGFCNSEMAEKTNIELKGSGTVEAALKLTRGSLSTYKGAQISAINAALVNRVNISELTVWVRAELNGPNLAQGTITRQTDPKITKGWNCVNFDTPYTIEGDKPFYIGYTFVQKANVQAVSMVGEPVADTSFLKLGETGWSDISEAGVLSIEAILTGDALPQYDLGIISAGISPYPAAGVGAIMLKASVANYGVKAVESFDISCTTGDVKLTANIKQNIQPSSTANLQVVLKADRDYGYDAEWTVAIDGIAGGSDENLDNNHVTAICSFLKNALVEEFTTEKCSNCPTMADRLHIALSAKPEYADRVAAVCHHAGYYTDPYTLPCDETLLIFYNNNGNVYAPGLMIDRNTDYSDKATTPVYLPQTSAAIEEAIDKSLSRTANAMVGVSLELSADKSRVNVTATCLRTDRLTDGNQRLTLYLTEDNVRTDEQMGALSVFMHQHLIRAYNSDWGEPIDWNGNSFTYTTEFEIPSEAKTEDMKVVAVIAAHNEEDVTERQVLNCSSSYLIPRQDGIAAPAATTSAPEGIYDLTGRRYSDESTLAPGIYIINGKKVTK